MPRRGPNHSWRLSRFRRTGDSDSADAMGLAIPVGHEYRSATVIVDCRDVGAGLLHIRGCSRTIRIRRCDFMRRRTGSHCLQARCPRRGVRWSLKGAGTSLAAIGGIAVQASRPTTRQISVCGRPDGSRRRGRCRQAWHRSCTAGRRAPRPEPGSRRRSSCTGGAGARSGRRRARPRGG